MAICETCDYANRPPYKSPCSECDKTMGSPFCCYEHEEKPTNADRIRAMTDEELKYIVRAVIRSDDCPMGDTECIDCVFHDLCLRGDYYYNNEEEWLKQPAEGDA